MDGPVGFLRFGYPCNLCPWKQQNSEISMEFEGSEAGIMKFLRKMKGLGSVAGRRRELLQGEETARPGPNIVENVRFGRSWPFPGPWRPMPPPGQSFWALPAWSWGLKMRAGNLLTRPTGSNPTVGAVDCQLFCKSDFPSWPGLLRFA